MDDLNAILSDPTGLSGIAQPNNATSTDPAPAADATDTPAPVAPVYEEDYESPEAVQDVLRAEWKEDFESKYQDASKAVQQFFKNDAEGLEWFSQRIGNHPQAVKVALRLAAIYSGNGMPAPLPPAQSKSLDDAIKQFEPGGAKHDKWVNGDSRLNDERLSLYNQKYKGQKVVID